MNCKQYKACLMGVVVIALLCGILFFAKYEKEKQIPADGILVKQEQDGNMKWA